MQPPFLGQITLFPYNFAPFGWAMCEGQLVPISQNTALFSLLGTQFGGVGRSFRFAGPSGPRPARAGPGALALALWRRRQHGAEQVSRTAATDPAHSHAFWPSPPRRYQRAERRTARRGARVWARRHVRRQHLRRPEPHQSGGRRGRGGGRQPAPQQFAALSNAELVHRDAGNFSVSLGGAIDRRGRARTENATMAEQFLAGSKPFPSSLPRSGGRFAQASYCRSTRTPRCSRFSADLWRRWDQHLLAALSARSHRQRMGPGAGAQQLQPRAEGRGGDPHPERDGNSSPHPYRHRKEQWHDWRHECAERCGHVGQRLCQRSGLDRR